MTWFKTLLNNLDTVAPLVPIVVFIFRRNRVQGGGWLLVFLITQVILNGLANYKADHRENNIVIYQLNCLLSLILFSFYFGTLFRREKLFTFFSILSGIALTTLVLLCSSEPANLFNSKSFSFTSFVLAFYSLLYFGLQVFKTDLVPIFKKPSFWIVSGIFTYYASNFFIFSFFSYLSKITADAAIIGTLWRIHNIIFLIMNLYISKGFLCKNYPRT